MLKKCTPVWREAHFQVKMLKTPHAWTTFEGSDVVLRGRRKGLCTLPKESKTWGFCSISKNDGRRGTFAEDLQRCISCGKRSTRDMFIRDVRRSGRWFCVTGAALRMTWHHFFVAGAYFRQVEWKNRKTHWYTRLSALHSTLYFWRKSRRIASFLMLSTSKIEKVSQNCFVFDVVKFKNWGSLAELFRFWRCQVQKLRKSRRIASFSSLQMDR